MKNTGLLIALFIALFALELNAQEAPEVQRPLVSKVAATWCPPCGSWGWTFFDDLILDNEDKATLLVAHHSGDLFNATSKAFSDNFDAPYQPYFYINVTDQDVTAANVAEKRLAVKNAVEAESMNSPIASAGLLVSVEDDALRVESNTKFFQEANGHFFVGYYVVESGVINNQEGQGPNAVHEKVLRASFSENPFGESLVDGLVAVNTAWENNYSIQPIPAEWDLDNIEIVSIIWKKEDEQYIAVNSNVTDEITVISNVENSFAAQATVEVMPTIVSDQSRVEINLVSPLSDASVNVIDIDGKIIANLFQGDLPSGLTNFTIDRSILPATSMYFLTLRAANDILSQRIIAQ